MEKKYVDLLRDLGLHDSEARVYVAALYLGPSSVQSIAKRADISRTAAYTAIEALIDRAIVIAIKRGNKTIYGAEEPGVVLAHLRSAVRQMQERLEAFEGSVQEMTLAAGGDRPIVRRYSGRDVARVLGEERMKLSPAEWNEICNPQDLRDVDPNDEAKKLFATSFRLKPTMVNNQFACSYMRTTPTKQTTVRRLDDLYPEYHGDIFTYADRIGMITTKDKLELILIENKDLAETLRVLFDLAQYGYDQKVKKKKD